MDMQTLHFLHKYAKTQQTATSSLPVIAKYVLNTNMPIKWIIYAKYFGCICRGCTEIYMPIMKSMAPTIQQEALYRYLIHITENYGCHILNTAHTTNMLHSDKLFHL